MKVLIITATASERSGWGRYSRGVIEELMAQGVTVEIASEQKPEGLLCVWHRLGPLTSRASLGAFIKNAKTMRAAVRAEVDVVHALDGWPYGLYGYMGVIGSKAKLFINGVGTYSVAPLYSTIKAPLLRMAYARAEKIFCISKYVKQRMQEGGVDPGKLLVVHMGTTPLPPLSAQETEQLQAKYTALSGRFPIVLTVGAIKDRKGQLDTLKAIELLKNKYRGILYVVAGSRTPPEYAAQMEVYAASRNITSNLLIISGADDKDLSFLYKACSIFALNSTTDANSHHFEGFGLVVIEAGQFGKPAVGSLDCGIEDAIQNGVSGLLSEQHNPEDIADKMEVILNDYKKFSKGAKEFGQQFSWKKTVDTYISYYR